MNIKLFCYGSNNSEQLSIRIGVPVMPLDPGYVQDYQRVFRGHSKNWGGGTATIIKAPGKTVYGGIATIPEYGLDILDRFEGVAAGKYLRSKVTVMDDNDKPVECFVYLSTSKEFGKPTKDYLQAVAKTVGSCWGEEDEELTWKDFPVL